jgi:hypothetical protein
MWWWSTFNKEARVTAFHLKTVLDCEPGVEENKRSMAVECRVHDASVVASGVKAEEGLLQPIVDEVDEKLTGSLLQIRYRNNGRITNFDLELRANNRRENRMVEQLRLTMARAVAGLDYEIPSQGDGSSGWPVVHTMLFDLPSTNGTTGIAEVVRKTKEERADGMLVIEEVGRSSATPGDGFDVFTADLGGSAVFNTTEGRLERRRWTVIAEPSAGSFSALIGGIPYLQKGKVIALEPDETIDLGVSLEVAAPGQTQTSLQQWPTAGFTP